MRGQISLEFLLVFAMLISAMLIIIPEFNKTTDMAKLLICARSAEYALDDIVLGSEKLKILGNKSPYFVRLDPGQCEFDLMAGGNEVAITAIYKDLEKEVSRTLETDTISFSSLIKDKKKLEMSLVLGNIQFNIVEP